MPTKKVENSKTLNIWTKSHTEMVGDDLLKCIKELFHFPKCFSLLRDRVQTQGGLRVLRVVPECQIEYLSDRADLDTGVQVRLSIVCLCYSSANCHH